MVGQMPFSHLAVSVQFTSSYLLQIHCQVVVVSLVQIPTWHFNPPVVTHAVVFKRPYKNIFSKNILFLCILETAH